MIVPESTNWTKNDNGCFYKNIIMHGYTVKCTAIEMYPRFYKYILECPEIQYEVEFMSFHSAYTKMNKCIKLLINNNKSLSKSM